MNIHDAKVLITGGSSGIGYATAKLLKENGAEVVICGRHDDTIQKAAKELGISGFKADVKNESEVKELFEFTLKELGGLNVVINNAGLGYFSPLIETSKDDFTRIWEINVLGAFLVGKEAAKHFIAKNTGNIINISSSAGKRGFANGSAYVASKFALSGLTECWRAELRPYNVRVMQVNPSEVITDFAVKLGNTPSNIERKLKPSEIAHVIHSMLTMNDVGFVTETSVWATNP